MGKRSMRKFTELLISLNDPRGAAEVFGRLFALELEYLEFRGLKYRSLKVVCSPEVGHDFLFRAFSRAEFRTPCGLGGHGNE